MIPGMPMGLSAGAYEPPAGQYKEVFFDTTLSGTEIWEVPAGVFDISVVSAASGGANVGGGGALAYTNSVNVTPGESLTIELSGGDSGFIGLRRGATWLCRAANGSSNSGVGGQAIDCIGDVAYSGGDGGIGAGGAAGYSGNGGDGATANGVNGSAGSGGGGGGGSNEPGGLQYAGGGVGLLGEGASGAGGDYDGYPTATINGQPGSPGAQSDQGGFGQTYGGGGGEPDADDFSSYGSGRSWAALRIIWGPDRSYPNNAEDV